MVVSFRGEYNWLSNFFDVKIILDGIEYISVEHAYMSAKSESMEWKSFCSNFTNTAGKVKRESHKIALVPYWDLIKIDVMFECLKQKYSQEPFKTKLLNTKNQRIQEGNHHKDTFWGVDLETNIGKNILGILITEIRENLKYESTIKKIKG